MRSLPIARLLQLVGTFLLAASSAAFAAEPVDFHRQIAPLFADHCLQCHGPGEQESGLRLDARAAALAGGDSGAAIVPGASAESLLFQRIASADEAERMPPVDSGVKPLTSDEIELVRTWIDAKAPWPETAATGSAAASGHWAYQPVRRPEPPAVRNEAWVRNPIDRFVLARLEAAGIAPAPAADPWALIKRLNYDLLGLPPSPEVVDAFLADSAPDTYEQLVDRLLASPHFGERWGRHWLDKARYADSDGYEKDNARPDAWKYRDWVIDAVNRDLPFDEFTVRQLAGDLLPGATAADRLATAFHRQTLTNTEGGVDKEEFRVEAVRDRTDTTAGVWLGLTMACAKCHDHKYDQISQREYYSLFAFFDNADETTQEMPISAEATAAYEQARADFDRRTRELEAALAQERDRIAQTLPAWEASAQAALKAAAASPVEFHPLEIVSIASRDGAALTRLEDGSYLTSGVNPAQDEYTIIARTDGRALTGLRLEALAHDSLPSRGPGRVGHGNFVLSEITAQAAAAEDLHDAAPLSFASATADFAQDGWPVAAAIDAKPETGWAIGPQPGKDHHATFPTAAPLDGQAKPWLKITLGFNYGNQHTLGRFRLALQTGHDPAGGFTEEIRAALAAAPENRSDAQKSTLIDHLVTQDAAAAAAKKTLDEHLAKPPKKPVLDVRILAERAQDRRTSHILRRGDFLQPQEEVAPATLAVLPPLEPRSPGAAPDRLDLARWLVDAANPLTPRVAVNEIWTHLFGRGLVPTADDFGVRGERPTNPALLDWLAAEYPARAWSRKAMIRLIVTSSAYRQSSRHRPELAERDPLNDLLARQNRFRVEGEIVRDLALSAAGLISPKVGGPSVFPPLPPGVAELSYANNFAWAASAGEDRYRRGMYTFFKRTAPYPNLATFDCPDSNTTCIARRTSNTALQALVTLNNETFAECARGMAQRVLGRSDLVDDQMRLAYAFRLCVCRMPAPAEQERLAAFLLNARGWYAAHADDAKAMIAAEVVEQVSAEELAAWAAVARVLLNLDEFLTRE